MSEQKIYEQMGAIMGEVGAIGKDKKNQMQNFMFRGIDAVMNGLHPVFSKHNVFILPEVMEDRTEERQTKSGGNLIYRIMKIKWRFMSAIDGSSVESVNIGEGMDSGDKAANKAMAISLKYALTQMLLLPYDEVDPDSESHEPSKAVKTAEKPRKQSTNDEAWVEACKANSELAKAFKDAGLSAEDGRKLWAETKDGQKLSKREQFEIMVTEIRDAKKESK